MKGGGLVANDRIFSWDGIISAPLGALGSALTHPFTAMDVCSRMEVNFVIRESLLS